MSKEGQVARAKRDLAKELGIDEKQITVRSVEEATWEDASLGVDQQGGFFAQVITDGYIINLEAGGRSYRYHSDLDNRVVRAR